MSTTKRYFESRAEQLALDIELTEITVQKIFEADLAKSEQIEASTLELDL